MFKAMPLSVKMFLIFLVTSLVLVSGATKLFEHQSYKFQRNELSIKIATSSVRLGRALIKPATKGDLDTVKAIVSAFAATPEVSCVNLSLRKGDLKYQWPNENCVQDNPNLLMHEQPIRRGMKVLGSAEIYFTDALIHENINAFISYIYIGLSGVMVVMLFVIVVAQGFLIGAPIKLIRKAMVDFSAGMLVKAIPTSNMSREFESIAQSFDNMASKIIKQSSVLRSQKDELAEYTAEIQQSLNYASSIQKRLIHLETPRQGEIEVYGICNQLDKVGGDLFCGIQLDGQYTIFFGDATGHGVPGALATTVISVPVRNILSSMPDLDVSKQLEEIHKRVIRGLETTDPNETDIKLGADALLVRFAQNGDVSWASAKQDFVIKNKDGVTVMRPDKDSIGYEKYAKEFTLNHIEQFERDDFIVLYTDGITDVPGGPKGFGFGKKKIKKYLEQLDHSASAREVAETLIEKVMAYKGENKAVDDMSVVVIKRR